MSRVGGDDSYRASPDMSLGACHQSHSDDAAATALPPSYAARGEFDLRHAQDAHDGSDSRGELRGISDGRPRWPLDQYRGGCVGSLDQFDDKLIRLGDRTGRQESIWVSRQ
jgi:hypothetical protein